MKEDKEMIFLNAISEKLMPYERLRVLRSDWDEKYIDVMMFKDKTKAVKCGQCDSYRIEVRALIDASLVINSTEKPPEVEEVHINKVNLINVISCADCGGKTFTRTFIFEGGAYEQ